MTLHWSIPLLTLPPIAFAMTLSSALSSFLVITFVFRSREVKPRPTSSRPRHRFVQGASDYALGSDGKKLDNNPVSKRSISFAEKKKTEPSPPLSPDELKSNSLVLKATGREDRPLENGHLATPVRKMSGQVGGKTVYKSPAPSKMIKRRSSTSKGLSDDDHEWTLTHSPEASDDDSHGSNRH